MRGLHPQGRRTYRRYYRCIEAIKSGAAHCPSKTLPALEIERVVVEEVRRLAEDRERLTRVLADAERLVAGELGELRKERSGLARDLERHHAELGRLAQSGITSADVALRIADLNERIAQGEARTQELNARSVELERQVIEPDEAAEVFAGFDAVWSNLIPREQARLLKLLIEVVHYDAANSSVAVTFRPSSIRAFMERVKTEAA
ncbi:MAG: recombinase zinc beta ribbon domain-containing protein [Phycisphaerales bacterium]|nr:recombinase zinc beta ribbon domain-containing protein [Phycisphaerales bacterium]